MFSGTADTISQDSCPIDLKFGEICAIIVVTAIVSSSTKKYKIFFVSLIKKNYFEIDLP